MEHVRYERKLTASDSSLIYADMAGECFGGGKNADFLAQKLRATCRPSVIRHLLQKYAHLCEELGYVWRIPQNHVRVHLTQLLMADVESYFDIYHGELPPELRKRFLACARKRVRILSGKGG